MLKVTIDYWQTEKMFIGNEGLYNKLFEMDDAFFVQKPEHKWIKDDNGKPTNKGYTGFVFYINELSSIDRALYKYSVFSPVETLEMMGGAKINTDNVVEAIKRNQIMLPNNLMLEMKELMVSTNACTNEINECLKQDWKLIAILPQHNQARPDYILGKM